MSNFVYCYLSPFLVGLLALAAAIAGVGVVCFIYVQIEGWYRYAVSPVHKAKKVLGKVAHWTGQVLASLVLLFFAALLGFGAWAIGIDILKRFVCK